jgi:hypothetical protein
MISLPRSEQLRVPQHLVIYAAVSGNISERTLARTSADCFCPISTLEHRCCPHDNANNNMVVCVNDYGPQSTVRAPRSTVI